MRLYLATYFGSGPFIETVVRPAAESRGFEVVSTWHRTARGPELLEQKTQAQIDAINDTNDRDLARADGVLVITHEKAAQTYCELARAVLLGKVVAVNTCGARDLPEAHRPGVARFSSTSDALTWLAGQIRDRREGRSVEPSFVGVFSQRSTMPAPCPHDGQRYGDHEYGTTFCSICHAQLEDEPAAGDEHHAEMNAARWRKS